MKSISINMSGNNLKIFCQTESLTTLYSSRQNHQSDSGFDLYCPQTIIVKPRSQAKINFMINCQMINGDTSIGYFLMPRSSIVKTPLRMSNSIGLIDQAYRGDIMAFVDNISDQEYTIEEGTRLFQIVAPSLSPISLQMVNSIDDLQQTERGTGGFGSTGK